MLTLDSTSTSSVVGSLGGTETGDHYEFDYDKSNQAALDAVNALGGIAGRRVEGVYYKSNVANMAARSGRDQENQRACAQWTEDNQVFAFAPSPLFQTEVLIECAVKTKTPMVSSGQFHLAVSQRHFESIAPYWYAPTGFVADRRERAVAKFLLSRGFFERGAKVGLVIEDTPDIRDAIEHSMKPVLAQAGIKPVVEIHYPDHIESPWPNYILQLKTAGVTHIVWSSTSLVGFPPLFMMRAAEDQQYRPKWGLASDNGPTHVRDLNAPRSQLTNVQAMGWRPNNDLYTDGGPPVSDTTRLCDAAMKKNNQPSNRHGLSQCEALFFLKAAFDRADVISPEGLAAGVARLGSSYTSTVLIDGSTSFGTNHHAGVAVVRNLAWDPGIDHFKYTTGPEPVPD